MTDCLHEVYISDGDVRYFAVLTCEYPTDWQVATYVTVDWLLVVIYGRIDVNNRLLSKFPEYIYVYIYI